MEAADSLAVGSLAAGDPVNTVAGESSLVVVVAVEAAAETRVGFAGSAAGVEKGPYSLAEVVLVWPDP